MTSLILKSQGKKRNNDFFISLSLTSNGLAGSEKNVKLSRYVKLNWVTAQILSGPIVVPTIPGSPWIRLLADYGIVGSASYDFVDEPSWSTLMLVVAIPGSVQVPKLYFLERHKKFQSLLISNYMAASVRINLAFSL